MEPLLIELYHSSIHGLTIKGMDVTLSVSSKAGAHDIHSISQQIPM